MKCRISYQTPKNHDENEQQKKSDINREKKRGESKTTAPPRGNIFPTKKWGGKVRKTPNTKEGSYITPTFQTVPTYGSLLSM